MLPLQIRIGIRVGEDGFYEEISSHIQGTVILQVAVSWIMRYLAAIRPEQQGLPVVLGIRRRSRCPGRSRGARRPWGGCSRGGQRRGRCGSGLWCRSRSWCWGRSWCRHGSGYRRGSRSRCGYRRRGAGRRGPRRRCWHGGRSRSWRRSRRWRDGSSGLRNRGRWRDRCERRSRSSAGQE